MPLAFAALFTLALTGLLFMVLERPRRPEPFGLDALADRLAPLGLDARSIPRRLDALRIEPRGFRCEGLDLVVTVLARDDNGHAYADAAGDIATETHRLRLVALEVAR